MAEQNESSSSDLETNPTSPGRSLRRRAPLTPAAQSTTVAPASQRRVARRVKGHHPVRTFFTVTAVAGLVATVAIPLVSAARGSSAEAVTIEQVAAENAQSLVVASDVTHVTEERGGYAATTPEEIQKKKDEEAAKKALEERLARERAAAAAAASASSYSSSSSMDVPASIAAAGSVVRPLTSFNSFGTPYAGHRGTDYMADRGTPIYAIADGVVVASTESGPGWGVYVKIAHNIGGQNVTSLYAHMDWGTRRVSVGETVTAGQLIGQVGDTGRAFGTHLHLEIVVNGSYQVPENWLVANVG